MKQIFYLLFVMLCLHTASASTLPFTDTIPTPSQEDYLLKSKRQRNGAVLSLTGGILTFTIGGVMVIGGSTLFVVETIGSGISGEQSDNKSKNLTNAGVALLLLGSAAIVTSIVLFSNAGKNKKIAMSMSGQSVQQLQPNSVARIFVPSVRFTINL